MLIGAFRPGSKGRFSPNKTPTVQYICGCKDTWQPKHERWNALAEFCISFRDMLHEKHTNIQAQFATSIHSVANRDVFPARSVPINYKRKNQIRYIQRDRQIPSRPDSL